MGSTERATSGRAPKMLEKRFVLIRVIRGCQDQTTAANAVKAASRQTWKAVEELKDFPAEQIRNLAGSKYSAEAWNLKL